MPTCTEEVFTERHRRWTEDPEGYATYAESLAEPSDTYGQSAARTFRAIAVELFGSQVMVVRATSDD